MDGTDDRVAIRGEVAERLHYALRLKAVQTGGWLVEEDERWIVQQLDADRHALALATADTAHLGIADVDVARRREPELANDGVDVPLLVLEAHGARQAQ